MYSSLQSFYSSAPRKLNETASTEALAATLWVDREERHYLTDVNHQLVILFWATQSEINESETEKHFYRNRLAV